MNFFSFTQNFGTISIGGLLKSMEEYLSILNEIESHGFVAYIVGGYVRDKLLKRESKDVDIITNATPKDLSKIFNNLVTYDEYGAVKLQLNNNFIDITTFRIELSYKNGKPDEIVYTNSLEEDIKRRDFTINTICMNSEGEIIDILNGVNDINNKIIKPVRDANIEFKEDPSRLIRALRFMSILDFKLDQDIIDFIVTNKNEFKNINSNKKKEELNKLFSSKKVSRFMKFIKDYQLEEYIGIKCNNYKETSYVIGAWSQIEVNDINFTKIELEQINKVKKLINKGKITKKDIYINGIYISLIAADILGLDPSLINLIYTNLPIKNTNDIEITSEEIIEILNIKPGKRIGITLKILENLIIDGKLENKNEEIRNKLKELR